MNQAQIIYVNTALNIPGKISNQISFRQFVFNNMIQDTFIVEHFSDKLQYSVTLETNDRGSLTVFITSRNNLRLTYI